MTYLLGLDIGTTSVKACIYDEHSRIVARATRPTPVTCPQPYWAEHDPELLWAGVVESIQSALQQLPQPHSLAAVAVASMGEAGVPLDSHGQPVFPIITYYDTRANAYVEFWQSRIDAVKAHAISGQIIRPPFGVMKLLWLRDHHPSLFQRTQYWLSVGDYILYRLAGVYATDYSLASRTMLLDQRNRQWSQELLSIAEIPKDMFPNVYPSGSQIGGISATAAAQTGLLVGLPVVTGGHDHLCGALAVGVTEPGQALVSFGTAAAFIAPDSTFHGGGQSFLHNLSNYCHVARDRYITQGGLSAAGGALAWLAELLQADSTVYDHLDAAASASPPGARGLVWLPYLRGSGTPQRKATDRAALVGLRESHTAGDIWRAKLESLAYWSRHTTEAIEQATDRPIQQLTLIGGVAKSRIFPQILADATDREVLLSPVVEAGACGAAHLAGQAVGITMAPPVPTQSVTPHSRSAAHYTRIYDEVYLPLAVVLQPINNTLETIAYESDV
ncbi:MAG: FGGY family carbohydrate kinase [Chloroflexota bacterium]